MFKFKYKVNSNTINALLSLYFCFLLNTSFFKCIFSNVNVVGVKSLFFCVNISILSFFVHYVVLNILCFPYIFKGLVVLILLISSFANFYMNEYSVFIDTDMIRNVFETNVNEAIDLINFKFVLYFVVFGLVPSIFILFQDVVYDKKFVRKKLLNTLHVMIFAVFSALIFYKQYAFFFRNNTEIRKLMNPENWIYSTIRYFQNTYFVGREFKILDNDVVRVRDKNRTIFVLIVGETARASNFSLNGYERKTNPLLEKEDIVNFDNFYASGTSTAVSVPLIFSVYDKNNFDVNRARYTENMIDLIDKSGMKVFWLENDGSCKNVCERVQTEIIDKLANKQYCNEESCFDEVMIDKMVDYINNTEGDLFIVLHMIGSHGPSYYKRYPESFSIYSPVCKTVELQNCEKQNIVNAYDNTILYTDYFLSTVINKLKSLNETNVGMLYVSDHGESLGENGLYLHGIPYRIAPKYQLHIPMLIWMSDLAKSSIDYECLMNIRHDKFSHDNLFHSILGLLKIRTKVYDNKLDMFYKCRK